MDALDRAQSAALSGVQQALDNAHIRQSFANIFLPLSGELFSMAADRGDIKAGLASVLRLKGTDPVSTYRGLIIEINSIFEVFIKSVASSTLHRYQSESRRYSDLKRNIGDAHGVYSAKVLSQFFDGQINGMNYDFDGLQSRLGICFSDTEPLQLNLDVFTIQMGNCTPKRLRKLFETLGLDDPFSDKVGAHKSVKKWSGNLGARAATKAVEEELTRQLSLRNNIVHSPAGAVDVVLADVEQSAFFFSVLIEALTEVARG